jgi:LacI family transcriptional regulator
MPTIRDVARRAGVAPITVSRVINDSDYVSAETRRRVEQAIEELQYVPNTLAQSLRFNRTNILALILTDITNPFWTTLARGAEDAANEEDLNVILCNTDENPAKQSNYIDLLLQRRVDGFLLAPAESTLESIEPILKQRVPFVVLDRKIPGIQVDIVRGDSERGAYDLTRYLIDLGHREIAILTGPPSISTSAERVTGYRQALEDNGIAPNPAWISYGEFRQESGYVQTLRLLALSERPTALLAANNFIAVGAMQALSENGLDVPGDISLAGFDDIASVRPFLTVVVQPAYEMGFRATKLLLQHIANRDDAPIEEVVFPLRLIPRESTTAFRR